jgi:hypothetical protein
MRSYKSRPFRRDRVYLSNPDLERLNQCGCSTCAALLQSVQHDAARRTCLREEALSDPRVLDHLERALGHNVDLGDPTRVSSALYYALSSA